MANFGIVASGFPQHWKVGDRVPLRGTIFPGTWEFTIRGIYTGKRPSDDFTQFWFRWDHLQEKSPQWAKNFVGWYVVRVAPGADPATGRRT